MSDDNVKIDGNDFEEFADKLLAWSQKTSPKEQAILAIMLGDAEPVPAKKKEENPLIKSFQEQIRKKELKGIVEYVIPRAGLAGKYCATVNIDKLNPDIDRPRPSK